MNILAGDVGGTRARFAICDAHGKKVLFTDVLESQSFASFEDVLSAFFERAPKRLRRGIGAASFGIAGPVVDQRVKTTNLPWMIDGRKVARGFDIDRVTLLNDLVTVGLGALSAPPSKLAVVHGGRPKKTGGNVAVIAAGTGLGEAVFVWDGKKHIPCPTEGSHVEFAPRTPTEVALLEHLTASYGHVSYERVASGSTIHFLYEFFISKMRVKESLASAAQVKQADDPNVAIVELAEKGKSEAAARAIDLWCSVYGAETGNLALKCLASAGVYVAGGVSARLHKVLRQGLPGRKGPSPFVAAFLEKGRMRPLLEKMPVAVFLDPRAGLLGAAAHAASSVQS